MGGGEGLHVNNLPFNEKLNTVDVSENRNIYTCTKTSGGKGNIKQSTRESGRLGDLKPTSFTPFTLVPFKFLQQAVA